MTTIEYKFSEGDIVSVISFPDMGEFEICGLHTLNGAISYTINDGNEEFIKYEYQIQLVKKNKVKPRAIGFKERAEPRGNPIVNNIGDTHGIQIHED